MKHPSLAPKQDHDPRSHQQVREAEQAIVAQIQSQPPAGIDDGRPGHEAAAFPPKAPGGAGRVGEKRADVVENRGRFGAAVFGLE